MIDWDSKVASYVAIGHRNSEGLMRICISTLKWLMGHNCNAEVTSIRIKGLHKNLVWAPVLFVKVKKWIEFEPKTKSKYCIGKNF